MRRPTIKDLAEAAGVSVATVNRVLAGTDGVRQKTRDTVQEAAENIGFYGLGAIQARVAASRPRHRFGFLLLQPHRPFYQNCATAIREAASAVTSADIDVRIEFLEDLSPQNTASRLLALAEVCDSVCITTAVHPLVTEAVDTLQDRGIPVFAFISQLSATGQVHYVGLDNWKVGRTAGWAIENICKTPGEVGILMGSPRYRSQEMNEAGFRSYLREHAPGFTLLEPLPTFESSAVAEEMTERLLTDNPGLVGLYVAGGGISGALTAVRNSPRAGQIVVIGYELMDVTRGALLDGTMTLAICHPLHHLAQNLIDSMCRAATNRTPGRTFTSVLPFEIYTRENI
jgi:LacI family transcriptional regulator